MSVHRRHPREGKDRHVILFDECDGCDRHALALGLTLDAEQWPKMWRRMIAAEFGIGRGRYETGNEGTLGRQMYWMAVALERYARLDPRSLLEVRATLDRASTLAETLALELPQSKVREVVAMLADVEGSPAQLGG